MQIAAGTNTVTSADLGMGDMTNANIQVTTGQANLDATANLYTATGAANGTVTVKSNVNATANLLVDVLVTP